MFRKRSQPADARDIDLIVRVARKDSAALRVLFERYKGFAHAIAWQVTSDHHQAEDVVQESFVAIWHRAAQFDPAKGQNVRAWILAIVHHRAIDAVRGRSAAHRNPSSLALVEDVLLADDAFADVDAIVLREVIRTAMQELPPEQSRAIKLNVLNGYTQREVAEHLHEPLGTIKSRIRLGLQRLHDALREALDEEDLR